MKTKKINRLELVNYIKSIQGIKNSFQENLCGNNFYFIGDDINEPNFQLEFIPQSKKILLYNLFKRFKK